jgi:hypothetical protein
MAVLHRLIEMNHALRADSPVEPSGPMLNHALEKAQRLAPHDVLVVIISDFFGVDDHSEGLIARLAAHNDVLGLLVHDPIRLEPPSERLRVSDGKDQIELDFNDSRLRQALVEDYQQEQHDIAHFLRRLSAPLLMVSNQGDLVDQVRRLLGVPGRVARG